MRSVTLAASSLAIFGFVTVSAIGTGCSGQVALGQDDSTLSKGEIDAGTGLCGKTACASGELCCASADESCSPTCTKTTQCPVYGRPCAAPDAGPSTDAGIVDAGPPLAWYTTCGAPICRPPDASAPDAGAIVCPTAGTACTKKGESCGDGSASCGVVLVCDDHDPKVGGCPISSLKFKEGVSYLNDDDLERLHDATLQTKLATYTYKVAFGDPNQTHLGFVIEDQPQSMAVERGHDRVDLYGYLSMVVATMQVQEKEIAALKKEVAAQHRAACPARK
jgi:hypothetical protein